jgi:hypothetical protein
MWDNRNEILHHSKVLDELLDMDTVDLAIIEEWHMGGDDLMPNDRMQWRGITLESLLAVETAVIGSLLSKLHAYTGLRENGMSDGKTVFWTQNPVRSDWNTREKADYSTFSVSTPHIRGVPRN